MPLMHSVLLLLTELNGAGALHNLFRDDAAALRGLGKEEHVISLDSLAMSELSDDGYSAQTPTRGFRCGIRRSPRRFVRSSGAYDPEYSES